MEYYERTEYTRGGMPITYLIPTKREPLPEKAKCKFCGSRDVVRYGKYNNVQRYLCRACGRKGADNDALPNMRVSPEVVGAALSMFYEGMAFEGISRQLWQIYHVAPSKSTLYGWIVKYSKKAERLASQAKPRTGNTWVVDETVLRIGGVNVWFWDVIDAKTRYLVASHISTTRTTRDAETVMERAQRRVGKPPHDS